jgi:1-acyl-sn-glycerol-3-phosphate acyltransferase
MATKPLEDGAAARRAARATSSVETAPIAPRKVGSALSTAEVQPLIRHPQFGEKPMAALDRAGRSFARWISEVRMRDRSEMVDEFGFDPIFFERWRPLLEFLYRTYWRVETSGIENIPDHDSAMIVSNHAGTFPYDGAMLMSAVKCDHPTHRDVRPLVEDFIFHFPFLGVALNRIGCVRACPENAERLLRHGALVAVFPEGIKGIGKLFAQRYQLQRFGRGGFVKLALQTRTPIIPAAVIGAEEIHPMVGRVTWLARYLGIPYVPITPTFPWLGPLGAVPLPTKWQIRFGEPIDLAGQHGPAAAQDRVLVHRLTEQVRSTIQSMVDEALLNRRSVFFG